ncbi:MAG TPA: hypothetical protein ENN30_02380 [Candidatus Woesearchaeota archaeon]|nr:hypothetical protein [Candidatus Woesearchaeota archaeon]
MEIIMHRIVGLWFYIFTGLLFPLSFYLVYKRKIVRFGLICFGIAVAINIVWELSLVLLGLRFHSSSFAVLQMIYQSLTEFGPPFMISLLIMEKLNIVSLRRFEDAGRH